MRVRWAGRRPKLWRSVINELEEAEGLTEANTTLTLTMCVNYGGRAEIADAAAAMARDVQAGRLDPGRIDERMFHRYLDEPDMPDVDLFVRSSGEQRTSNFLLWQSAYAELVFMDTALAGLRPAPPVARLRDVRVTGPAVRGSRAQRGRHVADPPLKVGGFCGCRDRTARRARRCG